VSQRSSKTKQNDATDNKNFTDAVEDALELANSARNSVPPRYRDAEIAYGLAAKLNPKDPRPIIGLGNLWYDQKQYAAAATMYKQALSMLPAGSGPTGGVVRGQADRSRGAAPLHGYLGMILIQTEDFAKAQTEFEEALLGDPEHAQWHALRGYSLARQGKTAAARKAFEEALRLQPENTDYQKLLQSVSEPVP
jgi:tetratricopeptide (TPR) repeat protein